MKVSISFLENLALYNTEKPYEIWMPDIIDGERRSNCVFTTKSDIVVQNLRNCSLDTGLETTGFKFLYKSFKSKLEAGHIDSASRALEHYLLEVIELVKQDCWATKVLCFDWRVGSTIRRWMPSY